MFTAQITLSPERGNTGFSASTLSEVCQNFQSTISLRRGNFTTINAVSVDQLKQFIENKSPDIELKITGNDEMTAASTLLDYFNHGAGI
jgi:phosphotransferase system HPr-like phosphotransfer protein